MKNIILIILRVPIKTTLIIFGLALLTINMISTNEKKIQINKREKIIITILGTILIAIGLKLPSIKTMEEENEKLFSHTFIIIYNSFERKG